MQEPAKTYYVWRVKEDFDYLKRGEYIFLMPCHDDHDGNHIAAFGTPDLQLAKFFETEDAAKKWAIPAFELVKVTMTVSAVPVNGTANQKLEDKHS